MDKWLIRDVKNKEVVSNSTVVSNLAVSNADVCKVDNVSNAEVYCDADVDSDPDVDSDACVDSDTCVSDENNNKTGDDVPKKKKKYTIHFREAWKSKHKWLEEDPSIPQGKKCVLCNVGIYGNLSHIERHSKSGMHTKNVEGAINTIKISSFCTMDCKELKINNAAKDLEMRLCLLVAEHNLSFRILDHLTKVIKTVKDSKTIAKLSLNRLKGQKIITSATGPGNCKNLSEMANNQYYSIIIDESTDISTSKNLAVVIRVYHKVCQDRFLDFAPVLDSTATGIFNALLKVLNSHNIPLKNLLGFTADNCNVMMGAKNGVQAKLKEICPKLFVMGDICHNLNLSSEAAASLLPKEVSKLIYGINHHFCHSSSRQADFNQLQEEFGSEVHVIQRLSTTRWLSREAVVNRILQKWTTLQYYFGLINFETGYGNEENNFLYLTLGDPKIKMYFCFLSYILKIINDINMEMQTEQARIHVLLPRLEFLFKVICRNFISKENIDAYSIHSLNLNNHMPLANVFCGTESELISLDNNINEADMEKFKNNIVKFYIKFCEDLRKRVDFKNEVMRTLPLFDPKHVVSGNTNSILQMLLTLFPKSELKNAEQVNTEYRALADYPEIKKLAHLNVSQFWFEVGELKNELNEPMFANIFRIVKGLLSLPHSSACVERIFSIQNLIKTKCRNKLALSTCSALIQTKDLVKSNKTCCFDFNTTNLLKYTLPNKDLSEDELIE